MNKQELIKAMQLELVNMGHEFTQEEVNISLLAISAVVRNTVVDGDRVKIPGIGTFDSKPTKARVGHNPKDISIKINIPASTKVTFKVDARFKEAVKA